MFSYKTTPSDLFCFLVIFGTNVSCLKYRPELNLDKIITVYITITILLRKETFSRCPYSMSSTKLKNNNNFASLPRCLTPPVCQCLYCNTSRRNASRGFVLPPPPPPLLSDDMTSGHTEQTGERARDHIHCVYGEERRESKGQM